MNQDAVVASPEREARSRPGLTPKGEREEPSHFYPSPKQEGRTMKNLPEATAKVLQEVYKVDITHPAMMLILEDVLHVLPQLADTPTALAGLLPHVEKISLIDDKDENMRPSLSPQLYGHLLQMRVLHKKADDLS